MRLFAFAVCVSGIFTKVRDLDKCCSPPTRWENWLVKTLSLAAAFAVAVIAFSPSLHAADCPVGSTCPSPQIAAYPPPPTTPAPVVAQPQPFAGYNQPYQPDAPFKPGPDRYPGPAVYGNTGE